jgi:hypothetical protein
VESAGAFGTGAAGGSIKSPVNGVAVATTSGSTPGNEGNTQFFADEAYGTALANDFGFGVGSGNAINGGVEQAGGSGGATAFGQGVIKFELDYIQNANFPTPEQEPLPMAQEEHSSHALWNHPLSPDGRTLREVI